MTRSVSSRAWRSTAAIIGSLLLLISGAVMVFGVHENTALELDGNTTDEALVTGDDWNNLDDGFGDPSGDDSALVSAFQHDEAQPDDSHHEASNKDASPIDGPGTNLDWGCVTKMNVNNKDDLRHGYSAAYDIGGDTYLFFGADRDTNNGSANIAAWFFQNPVACDPDVNGGKFVGHKTDGDLFIVSEFTGGGRVSTVNIFIWTDPNGIVEDGDECLGNGIDCSTANSGQDHPFATGVDCQVTDPHTNPGSPNVCATVNGDGDGDNDAADIIDVPWEAGGPGLDDPRGAEFFEGGLNLQELFGDELGCFSQVMLETRSSFEFNANLFDIVFLDFDTCGSAQAVKYHDLNADGDDDSEPRLEGWTINLFEDDGTTLVASDTTDSNGEVLFDGLKPGDYVICEELETDWFNSDPGGGELCEEISVTTGQTTVADFGNYQNGSKSGTKVEDDDADGSIGEDAANGLEGWTINAYADDGDGILSATEFAAGAFASDDTDSNGDYTIADLPPGDYVVCEVMEADWFQSFPVSGSGDCSTSATLGAEGYAITITSGLDEVDGDYVVCEVMEADWFQSFPVSGSGDCSTSATLGAEGYAITITSGLDEVDNDFGNWRQATKSGSKFNDANNNGIWDFGELGLSGWTIKVFDDNDGSGTLNAGDTLVDSATTADGSGADPLGFYEFTLDPGEYIVCEVAQATWTQTYPTGNTVCAFDSTLAPAGWAITLTSGQEDENNNFGNFQPPSEGCTPGFWQGGLGVTLWNTTNDPEWSFYGGAGTNPFTTDDTFLSFFGTSGNTSVDSMTMLQLVGEGGGNNWTRKAARDVVAAYLNASWGMDYPVDTATVLADWAVAVAGGVQGFRDFHLEYAAYNQLGCPIP